MPYIRCFTCAAFSGWYLFVHRQFSGWLWKLWLRGISLNIKKINNRGWISVVTWCWLHQKYKLFLKSSNQRMWLDVAFKWFDINPYYFSKDYFSSSHIKTISHPKACKKGVHELPSLKKTSIFKELQVWIWKSTVTHPPPRNLSCLSVSELTQPEIFRNELSVSISLSC